MVGVTLGSFHLAARTSETAAISFRLHLLTTLRSTSFSKYTCQGLELGLGLGLGLGC